MSGNERLRVRAVLKETISLLSEVEMPSRKAAEERAYPALGLVDGAIAAVARKQNCAVLTDDLDLYLSLHRDNIKVLNFTHLRASAWGA
jgi:microsomal dipeptidase-like Zn-dependent dipeptidase